MTPLPADAMNIYTVIILNKQTNEIRVMGANLNEAQAKQMAAGVRYALNTYGWSPPWDCLISAY